MSAVRTFTGAILIAILGILSPVSAAPSSITIPDNIRQHIPADAYLMVYAPSAEKLISSLSKTIGTVDQQAAMQLQMMPMMGGMMLFKNEDATKQTQLDLSAPIAFALSQGKAGIEPAMSVIIGVKGDHAGLSSAMNPAMKVTSINGSPLVVMSDAPDGKAIAADAQLMQNIPPGEISIAFDQALFYKQNGPMIDMMMSQMANPGMHQQDDPTAKMMMEQAKQTAAQIKLFMEMFKSWDFSMSFNGPDMTTTIRWIPTDPKMNAAGSADLGRYSNVLVDNSPLGAVMSHGALEIMLWAQEGQTAGLPGAAGQAMKIMMDHAQKIVKEMDGSVGISYGLGSKGMWCLQLFNVKNKESYMKGSAEMWTALNDAGLGISVTDLKLLDGGTGYTVRLDMQEMMSKMGMGSLIPPKEMAMISSVINALLGGEVGFQIRYLTNGNKMAIVMGRNGKVLGAAKQMLNSSEPAKSNILNELVSTAQGSPTLALSLDFRSAFSELMVFMRSIPELQDEMKDLPTAVPAGDPVRLDATCTAMTKGGQMIVDFNLGGFAEMMKQMEESMDAMKKNKAAMAN